MLFGGWLVVLTTSGNPSFEKLCEQKKTLSPLSLPVAILQSYRVRIDIGVSSKPGKPLPRKKESLGTHSLTQRFEGNWKTTRWAQEPVISLAACGRAFVIVCRAIAVVRSRS